MSTTTTTRTKAKEPEKPTKFVTHVQQYPTVKSGVSTFQSYPLGAKSVETIQTAYSAYLVPFLQAFSGPYSYIAPYVLKADSLADQSLGKVDSTFPIITKDPETIKSSLLDYAYFPFRLASDGKTHVFDTYGQEYKKCGGDEAGPVISGGKAAVTTSIVLTSETLGWIGQFLQARKQEGHEFARGKYEQGSHYASQGIEYVNGKKDDAISYASETAEKARQLAYAKAEDAKAEGDKLRKEAKAKAGK